MAVAGLVNRAGAGRGTQLDIVVEARPFILAGDLPVTGQVREDAAQHVQGLVDGPGGGIRPEVARAVVRHHARDSHFRERFPPMDFDIRVALVVLQADVVLGPVALDQVHFEDQRLQLRTDHDPLDVGDLAHQAAGLVVVAGVRVKI